MESAASDAVLAGAFDVLNVASFAALTGVGGGMPVGQTVPWTRLSASERPFDTFGRSGNEVDLRLHVYTTHFGEDQALRIVALAVTLMADQRGQPVKLSASGFTVLQVLFEGDQVMGDELIGAVQTKQRVALFTVRVEVA